LKANRLEFDQQDGNSDEKHDRDDVFDGMACKIPYHERILDPPLMDCTIKHYTQDSTQKDGGEDGRFQGGFSGQKG
jgi:hypothetical protein